MIKATPPDHAIPSDEAQSRVPPVTLPSPTAAKPHRILLVDDEDLICRSILRIMKGEKQFEIRAVSRSVEAPAVFITEGPFDLLLTDLRLPVMSGSDLAGLLCRSKPDLKVVLMSGDTPREPVHPYTFLQKPFDQERLVEVLEEALGLS